MWNLNLETIQKHLTKNDVFPRIAVETGTCRGNSTRALSKAFSRIITIELSDELLATAQAKLMSEGLTNIDFIQGNSAQILPSLLEELSAYSDLFVFLDAHWSGDRTVDWDNASWKGYGIDTSHLGQQDQVPSGPEQCPLIQELEAVVGHWNGKALVLIDDMKNIPDVGSGLKNHEFPGEDWSHLSRDRLLEIVKPRLDRLVQLENPAQWLIFLREKRA